MVTSPGWLGCPPAASSEVTMLRVRNLVTSPFCESWCFPTVTGLLQFSLTRTPFGWVTPSPPTLIHVVRLRVMTHIVHVPTHVLSTHHHAQTTRCFPPVHSPLPHPAQSPSHCSRVFTPSRFQCCTQSHSSTASLPKFSVLSHGHSSLGHLVFEGPVNKCHMKKLPSQATLTLVRNGVIQLCSVVPRRASRLISYACVMHVDVCVRWMRISFGFALQHTRASTHRGECSSHKPTRLRN